MVRALFLEENFGVRMENRGEVGLEVRRLKIKGEVVTVLMV